jgi:putative membrane protein
MTHLSARPLVVAAAAGTLAAGPFSIVLRAHDAGPAQWAPSWWDLGVLCGLGAAGLLYAIGSWRLASRGAYVRRIERVAFWIGWTALVAAIAPPLDRAAAGRFSAHMAQHELLMLIGAPLLIVGRPILPWLWSLPGGARRAPRLSGASTAWRLLTLPLGAWTLHAAAIWIWHLPSLYQAAVRSEALHAFQHATFVGTAVLFWWGLVYGRYGRAAYGASALFVFTTSVHTGVLGALLTFAGSPVYPLYAERAAAQGIDALADQQLAGIYMWIPAGLLFTLFGVALTLAWLSEAERRSAAASATRASPQSGSAGTPRL